MDLLLEPRLNNSTVFADDECERLGLTGFSPTWSKATISSSSACCSSSAGIRPGDVATMSRMERSPSQLRMRVYARLQRAMGLIRGGGAYAEILPGMIEEPGSTRDMSTTIAGVNEFANQTRHGAVQILQAVAELRRQASAL
jgi:hypothetical protein